MTGHFFCKFCRLLFLTTCFSQIIVLSHFLQIGVLDTFFCKLSFWPTFFCKLSFCTTFFVNCCPGQLFSCRWSFWPYFWELLFRTSFLQIVVPDNYFANCHSSSFFFKLYELSFQRAGVNSEGLWKQVLILVNQAETAFSPLAKASPAEV